MEHLEQNGLGVNGYAIPVGTAAQAQPLPWRDLDRISITFSKDVELQANDLSVSGIANTWYAIDHFVYDPQTMRATWTLETPLADEERVHLDLDANGVDPVHDLDGNLLDGEWLDELTTYPSGNGTGGGDFEFRFNVIQGDHYSTGLVDYHDYYATYYSVGNAVGDAGYQAMYDNDGNGIIESTDWQAVTSNMGAALPAGVPAGATSDAPTSIGFDLTPITDRSSNTQLSLHSAFEDLEDDDSQLSYEIVSQSNSALFDAITIDSISGNITLDPASSGSGRNNIVVSATDSSGLEVYATLPVDLDHTSTQPTIIPFNPSPVGQGKWEVYGVVQDDDNVEGLIIELSGLVVARVGVAADGYFSYEFEIEEYEGGYEHAKVTDITGVDSPLHSTYVGV